MGFWNFTLGLQFLPTKNKKWILWGEYKPEMYYYRIGELSRPHFPGHSVLCGIGRKI